MDQFIKFPSRAPCTWKAFRAGIADWFVEKTSSPAPSKAPLDAERAAPRLRKLAIVLVLLLCAPFLAAAFAPVAAKSLSLAGPQAVAGASMALAVAVGLLFVVGVPVYLGWRLMRFAHSMCERGNELLAGSRAPAVRR